MLKGHTKQFENGRFNHRQILCAEDDFVRPQTLIFWSRISQLLVLRMAEYF